MMQLKKISISKERNETIPYIKQGLKVLNPFNLSANIQSGYFIFSDSYHGHKQAYNVFNHIDNSYQHGSWQSKQDGLHYLSIKLKQKCVVSYYSLKNAQFSGNTISNIQKCVKQWIFYGSNNGKQWEKLDKVTLQSNKGSNGLTIRKINNKKEYIWYKFQFLKNFSYTTNAVNVGLIKFWSE